MDERRPCVCDRGSTGGFLRVMFKYFIPVPVFPTFLLGVSDQTLFF